jgi:hypothetical protein
MDKRIAEWLAGDDTGSSSKSIMLWLSSRTTDKTWGADVPRDAYDLGRCVRLLEIMPEWKARMPEMAEAGGLWATFSKHWDAVVAQLMEDCGGGPIPRPYGFQPDYTLTNKLMREVLDEARANNDSDIAEVSFGGGKLAGCSVRFAKDSPLADVFAAMGKQK